MPRRRYHAAVAGSGSAVSIRPRDAALVALSALVTTIVVWATPRSVQPGDAAEFATIMLRGGVPHPSGYPWMRMLGLLARPLETAGVVPATAAALPCAIAGGAAWLVLHPLLCRLSTTTIGTLVAAAMASASVVVVHACDSEVWGLHLLLCAVVLRLALARAAPDPWWLGLALGLAVSHHLTAVLLVPLAIGASLPGRAPLAVWSRSAALAGGKGVAGSATGLLVFGTLMVGQGGAWRWGDTTTWTGLLHHVTRGDYGVLQLSLHTETVTAMTQWTRTAGSLGRVLSLGLLEGTAAAVMGVATVATVLAVGLGRRPVCVGVGAWWGAAATVLASAVAFPALHDIDPGSVFGAWILERFDLLTLLVLAPWCAVALLGAATTLDGATDRRLPRILTGLAAVVAVSLQLRHTAAQGVPSDDDGVQRYAVAVLSTPEPGAPALVFGTDDHRTFPILFAQEVLGAGPDVVYIDASLLAHPWYRARTRLRLRGLPDIDKPLRLMGAVWRDPALAKTPVYLANDFSRPSTTLGRVPEGVLWRVLPPPPLQTVPPPDPAEVVRRHRAAFARYPAVGPLRAASPAHPFTADLAAHYNEPTAQLVRALTQAGQSEQAQALTAELAGS